MTEQLISLDTARLAKEKGFNWEYFYHFNKEGNISENSDIINIGCEGGLETNLHLLNNDYAGIIIACPQSVLQKWLRDEHKIFVNVDFTIYVPNKPKFFATVSSLSSKNMGELLLDGFTLFDTYEQALEEGLQETLKLSFKLINL